MFNKFTFLGGVSIRRMEDIFTLHSNKRVVNAVSRLKVKLSNHGQCATYCMMSSSCKAILAITNDQGSVTCEVLDLDETHNLVTASALGSALLVKGRSSLTQTTFHAQETFTYFALAPL